MIQKLVTVDMLKKFGEVQEWSGTSTGLSGRYVDLCSLTLEKGYVYEVNTYVTCDKAPNDTLYNNINATNCSGVTPNAGAWINYAGVASTNKATLRVDQGVDGVVWLKTYAYDKTATYTGYITAHKIGLV